MKRLSLVLPFAGEEPIERLSRALLAHPLVNRVLWLSQIEVISPPFGIEPIKVDSFFAGETIQRLCETCADDYLLLFFPGSLVEFGERALERMVQAADDSGAGIVVDGSGNVFVTGFFEGTATFNTPSANASLTTTAGDAVFV